MTQAAGIHPVIVGTAGHVDHGKSSLVHRLTGIDPDRWQEEKDRGLTIDLGFAPIRFADGTVVGMLDVPGHERFLKNMVAGATSIDIALLVVAADDGVMPQTREHYEVLELLGVRRGIVALTKIDLVDEETRLMAEVEIRDLLASGKIADAPIFRLSSTTGEGVPELRDHIERQVRELEPRSAEGIFRMPVQRVFSLRGFGTVLTGIPMAGEIGVGDQLEVVGKALRSRVRGIHAYGKAVDRACAGHSTAINLPDVPLEQAERGDVIAPPGTLEPVDRIEMDLKAVGDVPPLRYGEEVHLHIGTRETVARVFLLDCQELGNGATGLAQVLCRDKVVVLPGDFALLRRLSPPRTIAGGRVIGIGGRRLRRFRDQILGHLHEKERVLGEPGKRLILLVSEAGESGLGLEQCRGRLGWTERELSSVLDGVAAERAFLQDARSGRLFGGKTVDREIERIQERLDGWYRKHPMSATCPIAHLRREEFEALLSLALGRLQEQGRIEVLAGGMVRDPTRRDNVSAEDRVKLDGLRSWLEEAGPNAHSRDEIVAAHGDKASFLLERLLEEGSAVAVGPTFVWGAESYQRSVMTVAEICGEPGGELDIPTLRDRLKTSRKYLIPFLEHLDRTGVTARKGNRRILRRKSGS